MSFGQRTLETGDRVLWAHRGPSSGHPGTGPATVERVFKRTGFRLFSHRVKLDRTGESMLCVRDELVFTGGA